MIQEDVKAAVIRLLLDHPEGLGFNQTFKQLKEEKALGSLTTLSRTMKDLCNNGIIEYADIQTGKSCKIPKRLYKVTRLGIWLQAWNVKV